MDSDRWADARAGEVLHLCAVQGLALQDRVEALTMDGKGYVPELGQAAFGCPTGEYDLPEYACACLDYLRKEMDRVWWNVHQEEREEYEAHSFGELEWRPYYWGDDEDEAVKPNLAFAGVEIRWYKHPGRGLSCNVDWDANEWAMWMERALSAIRSHDVSLPL